jgi:hypothetical protein
MFALVIYFTHCRRLFFMVGVPLHVARGIVQGGSVQTTNMIFKWLLLEWKCELIVKLRRRKE